MGPVSIPALRATFAGDAARISLEISSRGSHSLSAQLAEESSGTFILGQSGEGDFAVSSRAAARADRRELSDSRQAAIGSVSVSRRDAGSTLRGPRSPSFVLYSIYACRTNLPRNVQ